MLLVREMGIAGLPCVLLLLQLLSFATAQLRRHPDLTRVELDALATAEQKQALALFARARGDRVWLAASLAAHAKDEAGYFRERRARALRRARNALRSAGAHRSRVAALDAEAAEREHRVAAKLERDAAHAHGISIPAADDERRIERNMMREITSSMPASKLL